MKKKWDVIIIGGGLSGLVAANYFGNNGLSILMLEKGKEVGGRARTHLIEQQYFNLGPHALYKKGKAVPILKELNILLPGKSPKLGGHLIKDNQEFRAPFTLSGILTTKLFDFKERIEWMIVLVRLISTNPHKLTTQTFEQWVKKVSQSERIQSLLFLLGRLATYSHAPNLVNASTIVSHLKIVIRGGVRYIDNGWQTIIDQLHNKAVISGIEIQKQSGVNCIIPQHNQLKLVLTTGEEIYSRYVLCTTGPNELANMLAETSTHSQRNLLTTVLPVKGSTLDVALTELPNPKQLFAMGINKPLYFSVHSNYARLSEDGKSVIFHVFKYHEQNENINRKDIKKELEEFLERIQPGWKKYKITSRFIPQITINQRLPQIGDELKLQTLTSNIPGLYIAGDWASPHSILSEGAVESAKHQAAEILTNIEMSDGRAN